jgi:hypothetical protein
MSTPTISHFITLLLLVLFVGIIGVSLWEHSHSDFVNPSSFLGTTTQFWSQIRNTEGRPEGFTTENTTCVYFPLKKHKKRDVFSSFKINDFIRDALEIPESIKLYKSLVYTPPDVSNSDAANSASTTGEYSTAVEELAIYKKYSTEMKPNETKMLDEIYGGIFDPKVVSSLDIDAIQKRVDDTLRSHAKMYSYIRYFAITKLEDPYQPDEFVKYFASVIDAYKSQSTQLDSIKTFLYKIVGPVYVHTKFIDHFKSNISIYNTKNDILYVMNTTKEILSKINMEELNYSPKTNNVYIFKDDQRNMSDTTFSIHSLTMFAYVSILMNVYSLIQGKTCPLISMTNTEFSEMFDSYMKKKFPNNTGKSVFVFAMDPTNTPVLP